MKRRVVLLVEDNPGDADLLAELFGEVDAPPELHTVSDGEAALQFLRRRGAFQKAPRPDLVLLDLNLPKVGGREVLEAMKGNPRLQRIPVVILSSSQAEEDVRTSYDLGANGYLKKPVALDQFEEVVEAIHAFWFKSALLPT